MSYPKGEIGIPTSFVIKNNKVVFDNGVSLGLSGCYTALENLRKTDFTIYKGAAHLLPLYEMVYKKLSESINNTLSGESNG